MLAKFVLKILSPLSRNPVPEKRLLALSLLFGLTSCSPIFVVRAGWEEAKILWAREPLQEVISSEKYTGEITHKLQIVTEAKSYAEKQGFNVGGSFSYYTQLDKKHLVWVVSGANQDSLTPVTWWFPFVGRVPYKGFFDRQDADTAVVNLAREGFDAWLRPSPAFSTLGWFDDPLLSTTLDMSEVNLVETVFHELLHNTVWVKGQANFNETLASFVGHKASETFFSDNFGKQHPWAISAEKNWTSQLLFAKYVDLLALKLDNFYKNARTNKMPLSEILRTRKKIFDSTATKWLAASAGSPESSEFKLLSTPNNSVVMALQVYNDKPWVFECLYRAFNNNLPDFISFLSTSPLQKSQPISDPYAWVVGEAKTHGVNCQDFK